ncbi:SHOCT domain-containing protein [Gordonia sp. CPCC 205515]|uniref:SHOCT domain-containing protein n=1 Tax=Gordonia sp. CPCC 205515 TaxID=3140791 RepID=UPI003AF3CE29
MWGSGLMAGGGWLVMLLAMAAFWVVVAVGIAAFFRPGNRGRDSRADRTDDPLWVLEDRFARGEIDADEYWARRRALRPPQ